MYSLSILASFKETPWLYFFLLCALTTRIGPSDGLTLKKRGSRRHPEEVLAELAYAHDIALMENTIKEADYPLHKVESAAQSIGLFLIVAKTKIMTLNATLERSVHALYGSEIEKVEDFLYLGWYTNSARDVDNRIGEALGALNALSKVWFSPIKMRLR